MDRRFWAIAAVAACSLLFLSAATVVLAAEQAPSQRSQSSAKAAPLMLAAGEAATAPVTGGDDDQPQGNLPAVPPTTLLDSKDGRGILGSAVRSATNEDMGRVVDVIVDRAGTTRAAVIDFGGFLGVGSRKVAVDWNAMRFTAPNNGISIELTRDQVKSAPQYQEGKPIMVLGAAPEFARSRFTARMPEH